MTFPSTDFKYRVQACINTDCSAWSEPAVHVLIVKATGPARPASTVITTRYLHTDALGSPVATTDAQGQLISRSRYEPYGAPADGVYQNGPGFTGHETDGWIGLTYMQQRYYDPIAARFLSMDPVNVDVTSGRNFGRYSYADNNPYKNVDTDGRDPEVAYGAAVGFMLRNSPEKLAIWKAGERAATTEGHGAIAGAAVGESFGYFVDTGNFTVEAIENVVAQAAVMAVTKGKYKAGGKFTKAQKRDILKANRERNGGDLRPDKSGELLQPAQQSQRGITPPENEAHVDHIDPRSAGGTNEPSNAQVLSRKENLQKSNKKE